MHKNIIKKALLSLGIVSAFSVTFLSVNATGNTLSVTGYDEGIKGNVSFGGNTTEINSVKYQAIGSSTWTDLNSELIRGDGTSYRFDILGLTPGKYNVKVNATVDGESYEEVCNNITVPSSLYAPTPSV